MKSNTKSIRMTFAKNVKNYRNTLKYSQEKLAEKTRLSVQTIKDIEGCRRWVSDNTLSKLARALNICEFQLLLPEKYDNDKKSGKSSLKSLISLREKVKGLIDDQFEKTLNTGDY
ncbi:MAG: helix-turn-helix transcriptional regulator [Treponema sp.]|nr:helix-turn-helix transcriptional regulator [Treponema sp.]